MSTDDQPPTTDHQSPATGSVALVGAGPGDPGLITLAGLEALRSADVVLYDALAPAALLREARADAEVVGVGKRAGAHLASQDEIEALMLVRAKEGKRVVRLKGGDPFVFGRGSEELRACREAGVPCTVVPGVTSAIGALSYAGIPVTHRGLAGAFMVLNARSVEGDAANWRAAAEVDTLVLLMGAGTLAECADRLIGEGRSPETPAASVQWGTRPDQRVATGTLAGIAERVTEAGLTAPLVTVVGKVAGLAGELAWFDPGPLAGRRVAVTRSRAQASELVALLEAEGAFVTEAPAIELVSRAGSSDLCEAVAAPADWWAFSSANGVEAAMQTLLAAGLDARALAGRRLAAVGDATADALAAYGLRADFVPEQFWSTALAELPAETGEMVTIFQSNLSPPNLALALEERGFSVRAVTSYENRPVPLTPEQIDAVREADAITFTSSSTARNLREALGPDAAGLTAALVSIGPSTSDSVRECFGRVDREAASPALDKLVRAVVDALA
ncbi:MAG: uroporphyrinogen-III C-methyltransferase [Chloroflexi bacterium]|nr:uroporphyrinogen-III C-methyltransferase [Chloroflexota bacterium]